MPTSDSQPYDPATLERKPDVGPDGFFAVDMRVGRIVEVEEFPEARKPAYKVAADFGPVVGVLRTSVQATHYPREELRGRLIVGALNLGAKRIAGFKSEFLMLGAMDPDGTARLLRLEDGVQPSTDRLTLAVLGLATSGERADDRDVMKMFTVGHGTRSEEDFVALLTGAAVARLVDVRRFPGSRRHPHFAREALERSLPAAGIAYEWRGEELGGRRSRKEIGRPTRHPAWKNDGFRNYADYMDTDAFRSALATLEADAATECVAIMCAETLWWRCHRRLIADALTIDGLEVVHLIAPGESQRHTLHPAIRVEDGRPVYDVGETGTLPV